MKNKYFKLFSDCKVTKGAIQATLVDLSRSKIYLITNDFADLLNEISKTNFEDVLSKIDEESREEFQKIIAFLSNEELGFYSDSPESFPELSEKFDYPALISNCILDYGEKKHDISKILVQLETVGCYDLQIRFFEHQKKNDINTIIKEVDNSHIKSMELYLKWNSSLTKETLKDLTEKYFKIKTIYLHSAPRDEAYIVYPEKYRNNMGNIIFIKQIISDSSHCGFISPQYFTYDNSLFFNESKKVNNCLSKKMGIDIDGNIKNCPALKNEFGNINDVSVKEIVSLDEFQSKWKITKDQIDICKDCEFRYVCTDCRAFTQGEEEFGKPVKCGYDPYSAKWKSDKLKSMLIKKV